MAMAANPTNSFSVVVWRGWVYFETGEPPSVTPRKLRPECPEWLTGRYRGETGRTWSGAPCSNVP